MTSKHDRFLILEDVPLQLRPNAHVRIFVSSHDRFGKALPFGRITGTVEHDVTSISGGATTILGMGNWLNGKGILFRERVNIVESYLPSALTSDCRDQLIAILARLAVNGNQEAVAISINGRLYVIPNLRT